MEDHEEMAMLMVKRPALDFSVIETIILGLEVMKQYTGSC